MSPRPKDERPPLIPTPTPDLLERLDEMESQTGDDILRLRTAVISASSDEVEPGPGASSPPEPNSDDLS